MDYHRSDIAGAENYFTRVLSNADRKLSPPDGGHLGCGIWQRLPRFPPSPVTLCLHLHYSVDPPEKKKPFEPLRRREKHEFLKLLFQQKKISLNYHLNKFSQFNYYI